MNSVNSTLTQPCKEIPREVKQLTPGSISVNSNYLGIFSPISHKAVILNLYHFTAHIGAGMFGRHAGEIGLLVPS